MAVDFGYILGAASEEGEDLAVPEVKDFEGTRVGEVHRDGIAWVGHCRQKVEEETNLVDLGGAS